MLITLDEAKALNPKATQEGLDALEQAIRSLTNNNFQIRSVRAFVSEVTADGVILEGNRLVNFRAGETVHLENAGANDGLYTVERVDGDALTLKGQYQPITEVLAQRGIITLVRYPADVLGVVRALQRYDNEMGDKIGIKSESVARVSTTYYDLNSAESLLGYPAGLVKPLLQYERART